MKKYCSIGFVMVLCLLLFTGCGDVSKSLPTVEISLWCDEGNVDLLEEELAEFQEQHKDEAVFDFRISIEGVDTCKEVILADPTAAADIFLFADDQFESLYQNETLLNITRHQDEIIENVGGVDSGAANAVLRNGELFAAPITAGNGYFLYYNKAYFSEDDVKTLDNILEIAGNNEKLFAMDYSSGWYIYSFFKGAGLELNCIDDGKTNICNWNATDTEYTGVSVAEAMLNIANNEGFLNCTDDGFISGVKDGSIIAGINGAWNASTVESAWGEDYAATMLPTYTLCGDQVQMCSFTGYKLLGINAYTAEPDYCMELVYFLSNEENQLKRFALTGECPANIHAASGEDVQSAPAVAALAMQSQYGYVQSVADPYWAPASKLGIVLASGNRDNRDLQELLDEIQKAIVTPAEDRSGE